MLSAVTLTDAGAVRPGNEDAVLWDPALGLLAVADGMGGHNAGEVASRIAIDSLQQSLAASAGRGTAADRLRTAILSANRDVLDAATSRPEYAGMGTTLTAALIEDAHVWFASVGDSRLYVKPTGESALRQLTKDDSLVGQLAAAAPDVKPLTFLHHPMRHMLTSVIGGRLDVVVNVEDTTLADGELLLLTTDGMHGAVGDEVMEAILDGHEHGLDLQTAAEHLLDAAMGAGGSDNITIAIARHTAT